MPKTLKEWKSFDDQLSQLKTRGLVIENDLKALGYLKTIGYYRVSGYLYPFRQIDICNPEKKLDRFIENTSFTDVKQLYLFDKKLRQLALDALERIEVAMRVNIAYQLGKYHPLAHKKSEFFDSNFRHSEWLDRLDSLIRREGKTSFVKHHLEQYEDLPIWVCCEVWDFGTMSKLYSGMKEEDKDHIAKIYHLKSGRHLQTHLHAFNIIRNISAHHSRLWNRSIPVNATLKGLNDPQWKMLSTKQVFVYFCLMKRMLDIICPNSTWGERFLAVLDEFPKVQNNAISIKDTGLVIDLKEWNLWKKMAPSLVNPTT
ncbi:TPA: Abi family protein [Haemophilus influenzae]|uniref:Abi family protein n=1 Tax=Haemophilus influenzae TaxID=727 RepID=UPI000039ADE4|nr:Abi family protein [Haemophilus influenzae]EDJ88683.1 hypothetical protein CGSHi22121_05915 [Haemophilus influenzae 22.1-21]ADO80350.1 Conserved hypothetical protein [Haemophilus influenzae R2866]AIB44931.1 Abortive infection bacteriophage resistance protein [Haemophilus influenzae CGSHiCZ412602]AXP37841.1 CAAX protease [Haemophilus influenzae]AXP56128.1 CAAX protease [Haemophilus influenzae]